MYNPTPNTPPAPRRRCPTPSRALVVPTLVLAAPLARWLSPPARGERSFTVTGATVREVVEDLLARLPQLRGYVLDDQGALRHHVAAFVNGVVVRDKVALSEAVPPGGEVYLVQALSGG